MSAVIRPYQPAYDLGKIAPLAAKEYRINPYRKGSQMAREWEDGFDLTARLIGMRS